MLFHIISDRYISYLQKSEPNVMSNKEGVRTYHRKYLGVLTELNGFRYFIPLSSPKEKDYNKQGKIKNDSEITIYIRNKDKLYGTLRLNNRRSTLSIWNNCVRSFEFSAADGALAVRAASTAFSCLPSVRPFSVAASISE
ncbi:MAG: type III toxin-antitoxin system ToxN/AbiQ family toxin [Treponema sp.]|nr:type III toxin-antitoxin system ToxN/AbiQ family toxin [Treponema sp.]